jgi:hypothetical protein
MERVKEEAYRQEIGNTQYAGVLPLISLILLKATAVAAAHVQYDARDPCR